MELSRFTDYSLRVLIYAGLTADRCSVKEIAEAYDISDNHLVKVVHRLSKLGYLETFRGRGGGIRLAHSPGEINVGEVVRQTESFALLECFPPRDGNCCIASVCILKGALAKARNAFLKVLDGYTLADLLGNREKLTGLLNPPSLEPNV